MDIEPLEQLLKPKVQYIDCDVAGPAGDARRYRATIYHLADAPDDGDRARLRGMISGDPGFERLFERYGAITLYCDANSDAAGVFIARPSLWGKLKTEVAEWLDAIPVKVRAKIVPAWFDDAIVFAGAPYSPDHFAMPQSGKYRGKVFRFSHESLAFEPFAETLSAFVQTICTPSEDLMEFMADYLRFSDGVSDTQWCPLTYGCED